MENQLREQLKANEWNPTVTDVVGKSSPTERRSLIVTALLVLTVLSMVVPLPAGALDFGIAISIATATMILVMSSLVDKPTDFVAFPVLLLISLLIRLSLNVSSTRLILSNGHGGETSAGHVIFGFSNFVAGGSLLVGLTVFAVISAVNFIVITKGSGRMAEVSARFALDSLPGKQLAIDADLSSGAITHEEAKQRRINDQREISFFGSLDGASKFVKGDAIAGIVITLINLVVGIAVGTLLHAMPIGQAALVYSKLTIGDGLVSQVPSLITSLAAALLLSRGGATNTTADMLTSQLFSNWRGPAVVAGAMLVLTLVPGMPRLLFVAVAAVAAIIAWRIRAPQNETQDTEEDIPAEEVPPPHSIGDDLDMDEISIEIGTQLVSIALDPARGLGARIVNLRVHIARQHGAILPEVRITDESTIDPDTYVIRLQGVVRGRGQLMPHQLLALGDATVLNAVEGSAIREPVYDTDAKWIDPHQEDDAVLAGATVVTPIEVLSTHLMEVTKQNLASLMTLSAMQKMIGELKALSDPGRAQSYTQYFDSMIPEKVAPEMLLSVLRHMLEEGLSIRHLTLITDAAFEARNAGNNEQIYENVRKRLRGQITEGLLDPDGKLNLIQVHPGWEAEFTGSEAPQRGSNDGALVADIGRRFVAGARQAIANIEPHLSPVLATPDHRRPMIRALLNAHGVQIPVIGLDEIDPAAKLNLVGTVEAA